MKFKQHILLYMLTEWYVLNEASSVLVFLEP